MKDRTAPMNKERFETILAAVDLNSRRFGLNEGIDPRLVRRWQQGVVPIPEPVASWLERLMTEVQIHPRPDDDALGGQEDAWLQDRITAIGEFPERRPEWFSARPQKPDDLVSPTALEDLL